MHVQFKNRILHLALVLLAVGAAFGATLLINAGLYGDQIEAQEAQFDTGRIVTSVDSASAEAGWVVKKRRDVPNQLTSDDKYFVFDRTFGTRLNKYYWDPSGESQSGIILMQDDSLTGIHKGEPFTIGKFEGERRVMAPRPDRPFTTEVLFWRDSGVGFHVFGIHDGLIDSDDIYRFAVSLQ